MDWEFLGFVAIFLVIPLAVLLWAVRTGDRQLWVRVFWIYVIFWIVTWAPPFFL